MTASLATYHQSHRITPAPSPIASSPRPPRPIAELDPTSVVRALANSLLTVRVSSSAGVNGVTVCVLGWWQHSRTPAPSQYCRAFAVRVPGYSCFPELAQDNY